MGGGSKWKVGSVHLARPDLTQPCSQGTGPSPETEGLPCAGPLGQRGLLGVSEASQRGVKPGRRVQGCTGEGVGAGRAVRAWPRWWGGGGGGRRGAPVLVNHRSQAAAAPPPLP